MKIRNKKIILFLMVITVVVLMGATECACSLSFNDYTAKAVNIKAADSDDFWKDASGDTLVGITVSLYAYDADSASYSTTAYDSVLVQGDGTFTFYSPVSNRYKLTATSADWVFVPQYIEITNSGAAAKDLYAYPADTAGEWTIIASWETVSTDVDLSLTYGDDTETAVRSWVSTDTYATGTRLQIHHGARGNTSGIYHDMDVTDGDDSSIPRVETISLYSAAWFRDQDTIRVYITANEPEANVTLTGEEDAVPANPSAYVQVDLMYYSNTLGTSVHYGTWYTPWNTNEKTLQVIDMKYNLGTHLYDINSANNAETLYNGIKSIIWE